MAPSAPGPDFGASSRDEAIARHEISRRAVLRYGVAGVGSLGLAALLAACGSGNNGSAATTPASSAAPSTSGGASAPSSSAAASSAVASSASGSVAASSGTAGSATSGGAAPSSSPVTGKPGGTINLVRAQDSIGFDKTMVFSNASIWVYVNFWETLTVGSADGTKVEPWLAESWEQSDDKLTWTFHLKDGRDVLRRHPDDLGRREVLPRRGEHHQGRLGVHQLGVRHHHHPGREDRGDQDQVPVGAAAGRPGLPEQRHPAEQVPGQGQGGVLHRPGRHRTRSCGTPGTRARTSP